MNHPLMESLAHAKYPLSFEIRWQHFSPHHKPQATGQSSYRQPFHVVPHGSNEAERASNLFLQDLMHPPPLTELAKALNTSRRSLQRKFSQSGLSYISLLNQCRINAASQSLLIHLSPWRKLGFCAAFLTKRISLAP